MAEASNYTHTICGDCGALLYCSEAIPMEPQTDYGTCPHGDSDEPVFTLPPIASSWHECQPRTPNH